MTADDKIERMSAILDTILPEFNLSIKTDALDFLRGVKDQVSLNIRMLIMVAKMRSTYPQNWKDMASYMVSKA